jgi:simple sugar transport system permease protein
MQTFFTRERVIAVIGLLVALALVVLVQRAVPAGAVSTLRIPYAHGAPSDAPLFDIALPSALSIYVMAAGLVISAVWMVITKRASAAPAYMGAVIAVTILSILLTAIVNNRTDIVDMLGRMVRLATPIALGALAGILCERSGVVNIAIEGTMLFSACIAYIIALSSGSALVGLVVAMLAGSAIVMIHAVLSLHYKTDQIISGTVINILAVGVTGYLRTSVILPLQTSGYAGAALPQIDIPLLSSIPVLGPMLFQHKPITYLMLILVPVTSYMLFRTPWGLRTRAIGEHPRAADTMGINVNRLRYLNVWISGFLAGLAGAWFSIEASYNFDDVMTNGRGYIALAAMIFGNWTPFGALSGALLFSAADALQIKIQGFDFALPSQFVQMLPYVITIVVLAGVIGKARPPAASGKPYEP